MRPRLKPVLAPLQVASLALGCVIGFGCFSLSGDFLETAGPLGAALGITLGVLAMLAISPWLYVGFDTLPQAAEEFAFPAGTAFRLMAAAILAGAGMHVVVLLSTGVVLPWRELLAGEPAWATGVTVRASLGTAGEVLRPVRRRERCAPDSGGALGPPRPSRRPSVASRGRFFRRPGRNRRSWRLVPDSAEIIETRALPAGSRT